MHTHVHTPFHSPTHALTHSLALTYSLIHSLSETHTYSHTHSLTRSLTHSLTLCFIIFNAKIYVDISRTVRKMAEESFRKMDDRMNDISSSKSTLISSFFPLLCRGGTLDPPSVFLYPPIRTKRPRVLRLIAFPVTAYLCLLLPLPLISTRGLPLRISPKSPILVRGS